MNSTAPGIDDQLAPACEAPRGCYLAGRAEDLLPGLAADSVHSVVTDPPYGLAAHKTSTIVTALEAWLGGDRSHVPDGRGFMSATWDKFVPPPALWDECYRILKPGGYLLAFAAPRTQDLMGISIRLAGFEIQDSLHWLYGTGFPKAKSRLKPAHEPIIMARKPARTSPPLPGLDGCAVGTTRDVPASLSTRPNDGRTYGKFTAGKLSDLDPDTGRYPPNLLLTHAADCNGACAPGCPVAELDAQGGVLTSGTGAVKRASSATRNGNQGAAYGAESRAEGTPMVCYGDSGGASRYFPQLNWDPETDFPWLYQAKAPASERPRLADGRTWPTVKPLTVIRWLQRLVTPPGGLTVDPCAGTGTAVQAALLEGFRCIAVDKDPLALELAHVRLDEVEGVRFG